MEKRRAHYDLLSIKAIFSTPDGLRLTVTSLTFATIDLGLNDDGLVTLIQPSSAPSRDFRDFAASASRVGLA
jgi:hypothetical protein